MMKKVQFSTAVRKETLAEQVASSIREAILDGEWQPGEALPTEPELAEAFGVSRAVVRDATRMLAAVGLVVAQHGRGVFVTESQAEAFGDALLLALRRDKATVWDVEQFEQMVFPEVCALAAVEAKDAEIAHLKMLGEEYIELFANVSSRQWDSDYPAAKEAQRAVREAFTALITAIFEATHNAMWQIIARPVLSLRSMRTWEIENGEPALELVVSLEKRFVETLVGTIEGREPQAAREIVAELMRLPPEAKTAMRNTPIGKTPHIRVVHLPTIEE
jgi:GntR family transcriptional repressor for pyruvate dehydrogenase complex